MNELANAADRVLLLAKQLEGVTLLADQIKRLGSIEGAEVERRRKLDEVTTELEKRKRELADVLDEMQAADDAAQRVTREARDSAAMLKARSEEEAARLVDETKRRVNEELKTAGTKAAKTIEQADVRAKEVERAVERIREELDALQAQILARTAVLEQIEQRIVEAKDAARRVFESPATASDTA